MKTTNEALKHSVTDALPAVFERIYFYGGSGDEIKHTNINPLIEELSMVDLTTTRRLLTECFLNNKMDYSAHITIIKDSGERIDLNPFIISCEDTTLSDFLDNLNEKIEEQCMILAANDLETSIINKRIKGFCFILFPNVKVDIRGIEENILNSVNGSGAVKGEVIDSNIKLTTDHILSTIFEDRFKELS